MFKFKIKKPKFTVEQIHEEFDTGEERILQECDKLLSELKIPTENKIINKAEKLASLGFVNSETVKQGQALKEKQQELDSIAKITKNQANTIKELKIHYPLDKFITVAELDRICEKYELIHAPVKNYIKDVPEKNVLEMENSKKLISSFKPNEEYKLIGLKSNYLLELFNKKEPVFTEKDMDKINYTNKTSLKNWFLSGETVWAHCAVKYGIGNFKGKEPEAKNYLFKSMEKLDKSGLFIAAPKSHFNLDNLKKKTKFGFFEVQEIEVKDPVVFEYCINGIVRIITKWGTEDDQSYLDSGLLNEIQN